MEPRKEKELIKVVKETLIKEKKVKLPRLGEFEVYHQKQNQQQHANGQVVLNPPQDKVFFNPD